MWLAINTYLPAYLPTLGNTYKALDDSSIAAPRQHPPEAKKKSRITLGG